MKQNQNLQQLAQTLADHLPAGITADWCAIAAQYHAGNIATLPQRPVGEYFGTAASSALLLIELGIENRLARITELVDKAIRAGGFARIARTSKAVSMPLPTDRKRFESGRVPWDGKR